MSIVAVILASSLAVLSYKIEKRLYNPVTLFCGIWSLVILFAALHLYGMKEVSDYAYSIMTLGIVCFSLGSYIALSIRKRFRISLIRKNQPINASGKYSINYSVVYVVGTVVLIYLVVESIVAFFAYRSGIQMNELRSSMMGYSTTGYASGMVLLRQGPLALIYSFVFLPGFYSLLLVTSVDVIIGQKNRRLIVMSVVAVVLKNYAEGSRMCLTHLVLHFTLLLLIYKRGVLSKKAKKWIKRTVIIIIVGFLVVSNIRFSESEKTMTQQLYMYFTCTVPLFDYWLEFEKATGVHTYGAVSLLGLLRFPCNILKMIGITFPTVILNSANEIAVNWDSFVNIGPKLNYNSYVTLFLYFYKDAGIIGVIMGSLFFGFVCGRAYKNLKQEVAKGKAPLRLTYVYVLLGCFIIQSYIRFFFSRTDYAMILYYALIFFKKNKERSLETIENEKYLS